jgi:hypothetical protein
MEANMAKNWRGLLLFVVLPLTATGCLQKDRTDTWYLEPSGTVTWSVMEKDVRSDAKSAVDRQTEEGTYMTDVRSQMHPLAKGFRALGAAEIHTKILRGTSPYSVVTEARFASVDALGQQIIVRAGLAGNSLLERDASGATWTLTVRDPHSQDTPSQNDEDLNALTDGLACLKVILTDGHFVAAGTDGFGVSSDGRAAAAIEDKSDVKTFEDGGMIVKRLKWTAR